MEFFLIICALIKVASTTEYTIPVLGHGTGGGNYEVTMSLQLVNTNSATIVVTIDTYEIQYNVSVPAQDIYIYQLTLNKEVHPAGSMKKKHVLNVYSDNDFVLQVITTTYGYSEGYQAIPNDRLGTEYYVSTLCVLGEFCQLVIEPTVSDITQIYIDLPPEVDEIGLCFGTQTWSSKSNTTIHLWGSLMLQLETTHDLTGTRIYTDNPVSVLAGSRTSNSAAQVYHLVEQLVPVSDWGTEFYVRPVGSTAYGNIVHITSRYRRTYVSMTGYPRVEMTGTGQTIKRRIDPTIETRIQASRIVQVVLYTGFTYASNETITKPGMTLVPAVEHYRSNFGVTCYAMDSDTNSWQVQLVASSEVTYSAFPTGITSVHAIAYEDYSVTEFTQSIGPSSTIISSTDGVFSGIINCNGSAIFPIGTLIKQNSSSTCTPTEDDMYFNDGIDNDCDGQTDEDYCFENKEIRTTYSIINGEPMQSNTHVENIDGWRVIKFRIRSCSDVKLELLSYDSTNQEAGKIVISIAKGSYVVHHCFPNCNVSKLHVTTWFESADCNTYKPYWVSRNSSHFCGNIGSMATICSSSGGFNVQLDHDLTELRLHGLYNNAIFNLDVYRTDCGPLYSDWRCVDLVTNCWEYEDDVCTTYAEWANVYCRKFCRICTPDGIGKVFKMRVPEGEDTAGYIAVPEYFETAIVSIDYRTVRSFDDVTFMMKNGTSVTLKSANNIYNNLRKVHTIYSDVNIHLFAIIDSYHGKIITPIYPLDTYGTEYMVVSFSSEVACDVIPGDTVANVWKITKQQTTYLGIADKGKTAELTGTETVGTVIRSSSPVAMFCGHRENNVVHFWTQLTPISSLGTVYRIPQLYMANSTTNTNTRIRIVANHKNTMVQLSGTNVNVIFMLEERGDYQDYNLSVTLNCTISANRPISVALLYTDITSGSASFIMVPPVDNYVDNSVMVFPSSFTSLELSVIDDSGDPYTEAFNNSQYFVYTTGTSSSYAISVSLNGTGTRRFQQSPQLVKNTTQDTCTITTGTPGDGIDNDCDGLIDEETQCFTGYGSSQDDEDMEGWFGEDCLLSNPAFPTVPPPVVPTCYTPPSPSVNPSHPGCWVSSCRCDCEWTESLAAYTNMTQAEKNRANMLKIAEIQKVLEINRAILSATVNEKESAEDNRTSSAGIGYAGVVLLTLIAALVVFFDLTNVYRYLTKSSGNKPKDEVKMQTE